MSSRSITARAVAWVVRRRRFSLGLLILLTGLAGWSATRIGVSFASRAFFATSDRGAAAARDLDAMQARWGADDAAVLVLVEGPDDLRQPPGRARIGTIARGLAALPEVVSTVSIADIAAQDPTGAALYVAPVTPALVSQDGRSAAIVVTLRHSSDDLLAVIPPVRKITDRLAGLSAASGLRLTAAGVPAVRAGFFALAVGDQLRIGPVVALVVAAVLWIFFRSAHGVFVPLLAAGLPVVWLVGLMAAFGEPVGLMNQALFTMLPVIAVADAVHWVSRVEEAMDAGAATIDEGIEVAAASVGRACGLTSLTTAAGMLSLLVVDVGILRRFGIWAAVGVGLAWLSTLTVVPLALRYARIGQQQRRPRAAARAARWLARLGIRHRVLVAVFGLGGLVIAGLAASTVPVDNKLGTLLPADHPARRGSDGIDRSLGGILSLDVQLQGPALEDADVAALVQWAGRQPEVRWVGDASSGARGFRRRGEAVLVRLHTADIGGRAFAAFAQRVAERAAHVPAAAVTVSGTALVAYAGVNRIATQLRGGLLALLVVVTAVLGIALRSWRLAVVSVPVNVLPLLGAGACLAAASVTLDPLAAVIVAVALGIAVDDTVHLLARTAQARAAGHPPVCAVVHAAEHAGGPILVSTLALAAGLSAQLLASFPPLQLLGALGATIVLLAVLADLVLLPAILSLGTK